MHPAGNIILPGELLNILKDNKSGSRKLLKRLNSFFVKEAGNFNSTRKFIPVLKKELSSFETVISYLNGLSKIKSHSTLLAYLAAFKDEEETIYKHIFKRIFPYIKDNKRIFVISNSFTVFNILALLKKEGANFKVFVSESRPELEGRKFALMLARLNIRTEIITEAMMPAFIEKCDSAIIGADRILKNGNIINKTGSRTAAILCKNFNKPLFVTADKRKKSSSSTFKPQQKPANEVWRIKNNTIKVHNYYFEEVEKKYITRLFTD